MINRLFRLNGSDSGGSVLKNERRMSVFVGLMILIIIFDAIALKSIDIDRLTGSDEESMDWELTFTSYLESETTSEDLSANQAMSTSIQVELSENEYLESVVLRIQCSDEDEPGEGFSDEVTVTTDLSMVDGGPEAKQETGSCSEQSADDLVMTWTFMSAASVDAQQTGMTENEVRSLFAEGKTGTGMWSADIELQVNTPGGLGALDSGERVTAIWELQIFEVEFNEM
ncbi:MAG: hypothetical protein CMA67_04040 [Euryarchaeota archaeon]|nr:hypothetical protein [Euryarchaeota archaeon]